MRLASWNGRIGVIALTPAPTVSIYTTDIRDFVKCVLTHSAAFAVLFGISTLAFVVQGLFNKRWLGFTIVMASGCALEVIGYAGRVWAYSHLWSQVSHGSTALSKY